MNQKAILLIVGALLFTSASYAEPITTLMGDSNQRKLIHAELMHLSTEKALSSTQKKWHSQYSTDSIQQKIQLALLNFIRKLPVGQIVNSKKDCRASVSAPSSYESLYFSVGYAADCAAPEKRLRPKAWITRLAIRNKLKSDISVLGQQLGATIHFHERVSAEHFDFEIKNPLIASKAQMRINKMHEYAKNYFAQLLSGKRQFNFGNLGDLDEDFGNYLGAIAELARSNGTDTPLLRKLLFSTSATQTSIN